MKEVYKDFVVVGGGLAGACAAISAARNGLRVALVHERPVLGGNSSSEIRVWSLGAIGGGNHFYEETGIIGEMKLENLYRNPEGNPYLWDMVLLDFVKREKNIELFLNTSVYKITMNNDKVYEDQADTSQIYEDQLVASQSCANQSNEYRREILSCTGWQLGSELEVTFYSPIFADCTGDGTLGYLAGAEYMMGREGKNEYNENMAPEKADNYTLGSSIFFYTKKTDKKIRYVKPDFAYDWEKIKQILSIGNRIVSVKGSGCDYWWFEYGGIQNTISDNEAIKDKLQKLVFGIWDYIKNSGEFEADNYTLEWISYIPGKRESRRLLGDYVLNQRDLESQRIFEDAVCYGGWSIDTHPPEGIYSKEPGCKQIKVGAYTIPFRSMYSKNINNLLFAGRNISATHIAFASTRVMNTTAMMGHAIGTAASFCVSNEANSEGNHKINPRGIYENKTMLEAYKNRLLKEDCYIIGMKNSDPLDIAREALVSASSLRVPENTTPANSLIQLTYAKIANQSISEQATSDRQIDYKYLSPISKKLDLNKGMYITFPAKGRMDAFQILVDVNEDTDLGVILYIPEKPQNFLPEKLIKQQTISINKGTAIWMDIPINLKYTGTMVAKILPNENVKIYESEVSCTGIFCCLHSGMRTTFNPCFKYKINTTVPNTEWSDANLTGPGIGESNSDNINSIYSPNNIINGYNRPYLLPNLWISDRINADKSQHLDLQFKEEKSINEAILFFNSDLNTERNNLRPGIWSENDCSMPVELVKEYKIYALNADGQPSRILVHEENNIKRYVKHTLAPGTKAYGIRIEVIKTWGNPY
ncbi:MAG TPA: FAD-dependent oxidoreductase, partial [Clostridiales bacterium]|nr:FAD-dependent oxidoreductase [Clostridiales bacterium]